MMPFNAIIQGLKVVWYGLLVIMLLVMIGLSAWNSHSLTSISIQPIEGKSDHFDKRIPLFTKKGEEQPDHRVDYRVNGRWHAAGTIFNNQNTRLSVAFFKPNRLVQLLVNIGNNAIPDHQWVFAFMMFPKLVSSCTSIQGPTWMRSKQRLFQRNQ